jgi:DivIVA domain-containing protein
VDQDSIERIRTATFPVARRGYDKREVDRFLAKLADWLETGGDDSARSDLVRRELERIGEQTTKILTDAHAVGDELRLAAQEQAQGIVEASRGEAEEIQTAADRYASSTRTEADTYAERTRIEADTYSEEARGEADAYGARARREADEYAEATRADADQYAEATRAEADARSGAMIDDANRRRDEIEKLIADLEERRDTVIGDMERLSSELVGTATQHRPGARADESSEEAVDEPEPEHAGRTAE